MVAYALPALNRWKQEDPKLGASLDNIESKNKKVGYVAQWWV